MSIRVNVNGELGDETSKLISPLDQGFLFGASVYETVRTYEGRPFVLTRHLDRLRRSAEALAIPVPLTDRELQDRVQSTLEEAGNEESSIRIIISPGVGPIDYRKRSPETPTVVILVRPLNPLPATAYQEGIRVALVDVVRNPPGGVSSKVKCSNLLNNLLAMRAAHEQDASEAIMLNTRGEVAEGSMSNIFLVRDRVVATPPLSAGILAGITRELTLLVAGEIGLELHERKVTTDELLGATEVFITSSGKEIVPVVQIGEQTIGSGRPGPATIRLMEAYRAKVRELMSQTA